MGIERKAADVEQVEADAADGLFGGFFDEFGADCAVLWTNAHGDALCLAIGVRELAGGVDPFAGGRFEGVELEPFAFVAGLDAGLFQVFDDRQAEPVGADDADAQAILATVADAGWRYGLSR